MVAIELVLGADVSVDSWKSTPGTEPESELTLVGGYADGSRGVRGEGSSSSYSSPLYEMSIHHHHPCLSPQG